MENQRDEELWRIAKKRVAFRKHLYVYLVINGFFWAIWFFTDMPIHNGVPWPIWPALGWGIGLAFNYYSAFLSHEQADAEKEYEKLKRDNKD